MTTSRLRNDTLTIAAGTETAQSLGGELDWHYDGGLQTRRVVIDGNASDSFLIEGTLNGTNWFAAAAAQTGGTGDYVVTLTGPYLRLRITKTGTNGAATVTYMV